MRNRLLVLFLCCLMAILPTSGHAADPVNLRESTVLSFEVSEKGDQTAGITYTVHDLSFDGNLLIFTVTQAPKEEEYAVYNDIIGDAAKSAEDTFAATGATPLCSYCESTVYGEDGNEIKLSSEEGECTQDGPAFVRTFLYRLLPGETPKAVRVQLTYGVMETPGQVVGGDLHTLAFTIPAGKES